VTKVIEGIKTRRRSAAIRLIVVSTNLFAPAIAFAQASPFLTGANSLQTNLLAWLTPVAIILVIAAGAMAMAGRASWGWLIGLLIGIPIAFGSPQIVAWIRGMFGT